MEIIIKKCSFVGFDVAGYDSIESSFLGKFLIFDLDINWLETYKEWALNPLAICGSGNETYMEKIDGYIYIGDLFLDDPLDGPCFKLTIKEYISLLDQWRAVVEARPNVITITKENDRLVVKTMSSANNGENSVKYDPINNSKNVIKAIKVGLLF